MRYDGAARADMNYETYAQKILSSLFIIPILLIQPIH